MIKRLILVFPVINHLFANHNYLQYLDHTQFWSDEKIAEIIAKNIIEQRSR